MKTIIIIWAISYICTLIRLYLFILKFKKIIKKPENILLLLFYETLKTHKLYIDFKKDFFNPLGKIIIFTILLLISPILVLMNIYFGIKKLFQLKAEMNKMFEDTINATEAINDSFKNEETKLSNPDFTEFELIDEINNNKI